MQRLQFLAVALLVGALFYVGYRNRNLREHLNHTTRALRVANKTDAHLQQCLKSLDNNRLIANKMNSEKETLNFKIRQMESDMKAMKEKMKKAPQKDAEIQRLKAELKKVTDEEVVVKKRLEEAQKALDTLKGKEKKAKEANAAQKNNPSTTPPPKPTKHQ